MVICANLGKFSFWDFYGALRLEAGDGVRSPWASHMSICNQFSWMFGRFEGERQTATGCSRRCWRKNALFRFNFSHLVKRFWMHLAQPSVASGEYFLFRPINTLWQSAWSSVEHIEKSINRNFSHGYHIDITHIKTWESTNTHWVSDIFDHWQHITHCNCMSHSHNINVIAKCVNFWDISFNVHRNMVHVKVILLAITCTHSI